MPMLSSAKRHSPGRPEDRKPALPSVRRIATLPLAFVVCVLVVDRVAATPRAFAPATGGGAGGGCQAHVRVTPESWQDPGHPQTDRHPVTCLSWDDAQEYLSWLSRETGASYRLPSEAEWGRAAAGSQPGGCYFDRTATESTCPVGFYGSNRLGLSDMVSNLAEWTSDCWEGDCARRAVRGSAWVADSQYQIPAQRGEFLAHRRWAFFGFRVARPLE